MPLFTPIRIPSYREEDFEIAPELRHRLAGRHHNFVSVLVKRDGFRALENQETILSPTFIVDIGLRLDTDKGPVELITYDLEERHAAPWHGFSAGKDYGCSGNP